MRGATNGDHRPVAERHRDDAQDPQEVDVAVPAGRRRIGQRAHPPQPGPKAGAAPAPAADERGGEGGEEEPEGPPWGRLAAGVAVELPARLAGELLPGGVRVAEQVIAVVVDLARLLEAERRADASAERAPQPGIDRLEALIAAVRGAGLTVDLEVSGAERPLPSGVELSAYRASSVCASAPRCSAATWPPDRPPTAATWSRRRCHSATRRWSDRDHPPAARRRPVHGAAGLRRAAARAGGHGGGRRGHQRRGGGPELPGASARRGADGRPHAGDGRAGG